MKLDEEHAQTLARRCHHQAVLARVSALLDDGHDLETCKFASLEVPDPTPNLGEGSPLASVHALRFRSDADERLGCMVTASGRSR